MPHAREQRISYEAWIEDLAYELAGEYAMHGDGEPRAHSVLEDAVLEQLGPVSDERYKEAGVPAYLWEDSDPAGRTRVLLYALYESLWPWSRYNGHPDRTLIVEADDRGHAQVVALVGRKGGEKLVAFNEDVDLRSLICRGSDKLRALYGRLRDQVKGEGLPGALRGRRGHVSYAQVFSWAETGDGAAGARSPVHHLCEDCATDRSTNAHDPVRKISSLDLLIACENCGAIHPLEYPEGRLPVLVGHRSKRGEDETFVLRVEFPMKFPASKRSQNPPFTVMVEDEADLLRRAEEAFDGYEISYV